jgi:hypothetical protein
MDQYLWVILIVIVLVPLVSILTFARWLKRQSLDIEKTIKCWDVFVKLLSALTAVVAGAMVFGQYITEQSQLEQQRIDLQRKDFYKIVQQEKKELEAQRTATSELYKEVKAIVARLARSDDPAAQEFQDDFKKFDEMYWANLIGIEGPTVEAAMVRFRRAIERWLEEKEKPEDMMQLSLALSSACSEEIEDIDDQIDDLKARIKQLLRGHDTNTSNAALQASL